MFYLFDKNWCFITCASYFVSLSNAILCWKVIFTHKMTKSATEIYGSLIQSLYPQAMFEKWSNLRGNREWDYEYTSKKLKFSVKSEDFVEVLYTRKNDCFLHVDTYSVCRQHGTKEQIFRSKLSSTGKNYSIPQTW